ncbi:MAG: gamma-glutamyltransferase [Candidatus Nanopelagicales bacterium]|nr:gamma-glutamyltransferase [Candidatus Nanopelagicales bacterium]MDZ4250716.1 gamma-glutamyltransferase [Candidatus Nanopelagicales bacterium]
MSESPAAFRAAGSTPAIARGPAGHAAVAAGSGDAALAAATVLRAGGNAVDAALAGTLAACLSEVVFTSLGGGGFLMIRQPDGEHHLLDFFVDTPGLGGNEAHDPPVFTPVIVHYPGIDQVFHIGAGSVAVPGALEGLLTANDRFGRISLAEIVRPAANLAISGSVLEPLQAVVLELVREIMSLTPDCAGLIQTPTGYARTGDRLFNPAFARFLRLIGEGAVTTLSSPPFAGPLLELMRALSGHITAEDLATYSVHIREPLRVARNGFGIALNAPPAFGGAIVADALARLSPIDGGVESWSRAVEALAAATEANRVADIKAGIPHVTEGTTHISVVDADGQVASMTTSNGSGSGLLIPGTGIHLNNMLGEEDLNPRGFHVMSPGIRMGSMMAPTILSHPDGSVTGLGTGGSERIRSALMTTLLRMTDLGCSAAKAVACPRMHAQADGVQLEPGWDPELPTALGGPVNIWDEPNLFFGGVHAVTRWSDGSVQAVGDSRRGGATAVVPV